MENINLSDTKEKGRVREDLKTVLYNSAVITKPTTVETYSCGL
jgi:hypothetical protein